MTTSDLTTDQIARLTNSELTMHATQIILGAMAGGRIRDQTAEHAHELWMEMNRRIIDSVILGEHHV
jgi:hypothetical protein